MSKPKAKATLASILAITHKDPWQQRVRFIQALADWAHDVPGRAALPQEHLPDNARMILYLNGLHGELNSSGLFYVIDHEIGNHFAFAVKSLKLIGAKKSVGYLEAFAKLYPKSKVPDSPEERMETLEESLGDKFEKKLDELDGKYRKDVLDEIPDKLREYVAKNLAKVEAEAAHAAKQHKGGKRDQIIESESHSISGYRDSYEYARKKTDEELFANVPAPKIGDVIQVFAKKRYAYLQVTHEHFYFRTRGPVVRVLPGLHERPVTGARLQSLVAEPELYFNLFNVRNYMWVPKSERRDLMGAYELDIVANLAVPKHAKPFPDFLFHFGKTLDGRNVWALWKGGESVAEKFISPLSEEQKSLSWASIAYDPPVVVDEIKSGWKPLDEYSSWGDV